MVELVDMKCAELLGALNEHVDGAMDPEICGAFEAHKAAAVRKP